MQGRCTGGGGHGCGSGQGLHGCDAVKWAVEPIVVGVLCSEVTVHTQPSVGGLRMVGERGLISFPPLPSLSHYQLTAPTSV